MPIDDRVRKLAREVTRGKKSELDKARAIYDYVVDNMSYDKSTGWGNGDIFWACDTKEKRAYFFGAHDENRVQFTSGRDLVLNPRQGGEPLNYFIDPYVEVNGQPHANVAKTFQYKDRGEQAGTTRK